MAAAARTCLLGLAALALLVLLAGVAQLVCGLFLLLKAPQPAANGAVIFAGVWDVLVGLLTATLCLTGPRRAWRRSQLQLAVLCTGPVVNVAQGIVAGLAPRPPLTPEAATVCKISLYSTIAAAVASFAAANLVFCMQLVFERYRPGTRSWASPKSTSSGVYFVEYGATQMVQKPGAPDLWLSAGTPLASWVYRSQSSAETPPATRLDDPPAPGDFKPAPADSGPGSGGGGDMLLRVAPADVALCATSVPTPSSATSGGGAAAAGRLPRCLSLLSSIYGPSRGGWPPSGRQLRSFSLLEVRPPTVADAERPGSSDSLLLRRPPAAAIAEEAAPRAPFPPAPAPLRASPLQTPLPARAAADSPLTDTIRRLTSALGRIQAEPDFRASRELEEALATLQQLELAPLASTRRPAAELGRPDSSASHASSSGYGSPDGSKEAAPEERPPATAQPDGDDYQRRSVVQLVSLMERAPAARRPGSDLRRPAVPPPPPPPPQQQPSGGAERADAAKWSEAPALKAPDVSGPDRSNRRPVESEC